MNEELFKSVFNNIVLLRTIYYHVRLYKKNEFVKFNSRKELLGYEERDYIQSIMFGNDYNKEMLIKGDLPIYGVLKEVIFGNTELSVIKGDAIPYGVEIVTYLYSKYSQFYSTTLSTLPSTVHTVNNVVIKKSSTNITIPPNITSITFKECPDISSGEFNIPNTIKKLVLPNNWYNHNIEINKGDIPKGITSLNIGEYNIKNMGEKILPDSIKKLKLNYYGGGSSSNNNNNNSFNFLPPNIESLSIKSSYDINRELNLFKYNSIKKLKFSGNDLYGSKFEPNSLPPNLETLKLKRIESLSEKKIIPNNVKFLEIDFSNPKDCFLSKNVIPKKVVSLKLNKCIKETGVFPSSLTHLKLIIYTYTKEDLIKTISIFPKSLSSIAIPLLFKDDSIIKKLPKTINKIEYFY